MKGLANEGATCWLNALIQCMRSSRTWSETPHTGDSFTDEFLKLMQGSDDTKPFLAHLGMDLGANDAQEAYLIILDRLKGDFVADFKGIQKQTLVTPKGRTHITEEFTIWFEPTAQHEVIEDYEGNHITVMMRTIEQIPKVLVSTSVSETLHGKHLASIIHWGGGHYVASVKQPNGEWLIANDLEITKASPCIRGYFAFYKD